MTSTLASVLHLSAHAIDRPAPRERGVRSLPLQAGGRWRRLGGSLIDLLQSLSVSHQTPSDQAMRNLSSTERPRY